MQHFSQAERNLEQLYLSPAVYQPRLNDVGSTVADRLRIRRSGQIFYDRLRRFDDTCGLPECIVCQKPMDVAKVMRRSLIATSDHPAT